jgi:hypothetical protein
MDIHTGDRVLVNLAPFIGSLRRHPESILCRVLAIDGSRVEVLTEFPCRDFSLWVASNWIEGRSDSPHALAPRGSSEDSIEDSELRSARPKGMDHRRYLSAAVN